jgi:hypothetical protein
VRRIGGAQRYHRVTPHAKHADGFRKRSTHPTGSAPPVCSPDERSDIRVSIFESRISLRSCGLRLLFPEAGPLAGAAR